MNDEVEVFLEHHGVKGMKWGVHRQAKADANEYAKAQLFYGKGAGTRRKLIKAKVETRSKDPQYKAAFEHHLANQNLEKRARQAKSLRLRKDSVHNVAKTTRGVHRSLTGGFGAVTVTSAAIAGAYLYARKTGLDKKLMNKAAETYRNRNNYAEVAAWLKTQGVG